jgi:hypothetical protein
MQVPLPQRAVLEPHTDVWFSRAGGNAIQRVVSDAQLTFVFSVKDGKWQLNTSVPLTGAHAPLLRALSSALLTAADTLASAPKPTTSAPTKTEPSAKV